MGRLPRLAFRDGGEVLLQSRRGRPLGRFFPELIEALAALPVAALRPRRRDRDPQAGLRGAAAAAAPRRVAHRQAVGRASRDLRRLRPAGDASGASLLERPFKERRAALDAFFARTGKTERGDQVARDARARPGDEMAARRRPRARRHRRQAPRPAVPPGRALHAQVQAAKTYDCVVGGLYLKRGTRRVEYLLLGLYDAEGRLDYVGRAGVGADEPQIRARLRGLIGKGGFTGRAPGGKSRWSSRERDDVPLAPALVVEVGADHITDRKFRHGARLLRWRDDKTPEACTLDQLGDGLTGATGSQRRPAARPPGPDEQFDRLRFQRACGCSGRGLRGPGEFGYILPGRSQLEIRASGVFTRARHHDQNAEARAPPCSPSMPSPSAWAGSVILDRASAAIPTAQPRRPGRAQRRRQVDPDEGHRRARRGRRRLGRDAARHAHRLCRAGGARRPRHAVRDRARRRHRARTPARRGRARARPAPPRPRSTSGSTPSTRMPRRRARPASSPGSASTRRRSSSRSIAFSGGWRMRVALAALLFSEPDLLLLDEPSNHLDLEATLWLEVVPQGLPRRRMLVVSHERDLLNNVVDHILHLEGGKTTLYAGGYDSFERQRRERQAQPRRRAPSRRRERAKLQAYRRPLALQGAHRAPGAEPPEGAGADGADRRGGGRSHPGVRLPQPGRAEAAADHARGRRGRLCRRTSRSCTRLSLRLDPDDRIALLGRNGNGKTTLARLLVGPTCRRWRAAMTASGKLRVGYFAQHQVEELDARGHAAAAHGAADARRQARRGARAARPLRLLRRQGRCSRCGKLSGGERARLALALITRDAPHMLILDEPTNHLDVDAREALVQALNEYERRGRRGQPRPPSARADRRPAGAGRRRHRQGIRRHARRLSRPVLRRSDGGEAAGRRGASASAARTSAASRPKRASAARRCARRCKRAEAEVAQLDGAAHRRSTAPCSIPTAADGAGEGRDHDRS